LQFTSVGSNEAFEPSARALSFAAVLHLHSHLGTQGIESVDSPTSLRPGALGDAPGRGAAVPGDR
jgi:hypothetical protein